MQLPDAMILAFNYLEDTYKPSWTTGLGNRNALLAAFSQVLIPKHTYLGYKGGDGIRHSFNRAIPTHNKPKGVLWETWLLHNINMFYCHTCQEVFGMKDTTVGKTGICKKCDSNRVKGRSNSVRSWVYNYLQNNPCKDCGEANPIVLEFDHLDPSTKSFNIGEAYSKSLDSVKKEISKCDVVCANCHRIRTAKAYSFYKYKQVS